MPNPYKPPKTEWTANSSANETSVSEHQRVIRYVGLGWGSSVFGLIVDSTLRLFGTYPPTAITLLTYLFFSVIAPGLMTWTIKKNFGIKTALAAGTWLPPLYVIALALGNLS